MPDYYSQAIAEATKECGGNPQEMVGFLANRNAAHRRLAERIANLNPEHAGIGAGMLASLVSEARLLLPSEAIETRI
jgi:hypothetical protein